MISTRILALAAALLAGPLHAQMVTGPATAVDGRTLDMTGSAIVLAHIDAPESAQMCQKDGQPWNCGEEATASLAAIIGQGPITCHVIGTDTEGTPLAICENEVFDLGREMVRRGMALALDGAPEEYGAATGIAQQLQYGLWAAQFQPPAEWRAAHPAAVRRVARAESIARKTRQASERTAPERRYTSALGCAIKGNHSRYGDYIYHLPGQRYYQETRPEALFCTESEARAAGFRRSKE